MTPEMLFLGKPLNFEPVPGLKLDDKYQDKVDAKLQPILWVHDVEAGSPAAQDGFKRGDGILNFAGIVDQKV